MHHVRGDVQDRQGRADDAEGEAGGALPEEHGRPGRARGQARQGACADVTSSDTGHQGGQLGLGDVGVYQP